MSWCVSVGVVCVRLGDSARLGWLGLGAVVWQCYWCSFVLVSVALVVCS